MARKSRNPYLQRKDTDAATEGEQKCAYYIRLSVEDNGRGNSHSIQNQYEYLRSYNEEHKELLFQGAYIDNGYTGTNYDRPAFLRLLEEAEEKKITCILIKDLSRLGRNYLETAYYLEQLFPQKGIRLISINDGYDSAKISQGELITAVINIQNDQYAREISKRIRSSLNAKREKGCFIGAMAPFGYKRDIQRSGGLIKDAAVEGIVARIFSMKQQGSSNGEIARSLNEAGILCPGRYLYELNNHRKYLKYKKVCWNTGTLKRMFDNPVYCGDLLQGRYSRSVYDLKQEKQLYYKRDAHEPYVSREVMTKIRGSDGENGTGTDPIS